MCQYNAVTQCKQENNGQDCVQWGNIMIPSCRSGFTQYADICITQCPFGYKPNDFVSCFKPASYQKPVFSAKQLGLSDESTLKMCQTNFRVCDSLGEGSYKPRDFSCQPNFKLVGEECIPQCPPLFYDSQQNNQLCLKQIYPFKGYTRYSTSCYYTSLNSPQRTGVHDMNDTLKMIDYYLRMGNESPYLYNTINYFLELDNRIYDLNISTQTYQSL